MQEKFIQIAAKKPGGSAPPIRTHYAEEVAVLRLAPDWLNALQAFTYRIRNEKLATATPIAPALAADLHHLLDS